jgi:hypothetical protein
LEDGLGDEANQILADDMLGGNVDEVLCSFALGFCINDSRKLLFEGFDRFGDGFG